MYKGKLVKILPLETGEGKKGTWTKQMFIIETFDQYPKTIAFITWSNDIIRRLETMQPNTNIQVSASPESREYEGRWYTDLRAYRLDLL